MNSRKTERGAKQFLTRLAVRAAPFALSEELAHNGLASGRPIRKFLFGLGPRSAACALLRNSRKTERGAKQFLTRPAARAAPFALLSE
jgi:hypothetical protein